MLFVALPNEAKSVQAIRPETQWTSTDYLLWTIEFNIRALQWSLADEKARRGKQPPKPLPTPAETAHNSKRRDNALKNKREIDEILGMKGA